MSEQLEMLTADMMMMRLAASAMAGRADLASKAGLTFGGDRDFYKAFGYKRLLTPADYRERYERGGIAGRIVDSFPNSCWQTGGRVAEDKKPKSDTEFEAAWKALEKRLKIWSVFRRADILAGLGRYSIIVIGAPGKMEEELKSVTADQIAYLRPYGEDEAPIQTYEIDAASPRYALPITYNLLNTNITSTEQGKSTAARIVHWSRVIHIADNVLDHPAYGASRLKKIWNDLDNLDKVVGGGAEAFFKRADAGIQFELDPMLKFDEPAKQAVKDMLEDYTHNVRRNLITRGMQINRLGSDVADFKGPSSAILEILSASTGIPSRILMGSERGHLASTQDKSNWDERVTSRRTDFCEGQVVNQTVDRFIALKTLPTPKEYFTAWPEIEELSEDEKVTTARNVAGVNQTQGETVVTTDEIREKYLGLEPFTPEQKAEMQAKKDEAAAAAQEAAAANPGAKAFEAAMRHAESTLRTPELRTAILENDVVKVKAILEESTRVIERELAVA